MDQITPEMDHVCILASATFVKFTRVINVVYSETQLRAHDAPRCPPGSTDLHPARPGDCAAHEVQAEPGRKPGPPPQPPAPPVRRRA